MPVQHPDEGERAWGGRLPLAEAGGLDAEQQTLADQLHAFAVPWAEQAGFAATTLQGRLIGPWNGQLHRPGPATAFNQWVLADQQGTSLPARIREVVILTVGTAWQSAYEIYSHDAAARTAGLSDSVIAALRAHRSTEDLSGDDLAAHRFADELVRGHDVEDRTYQEATARFGQDGVIDLVHLVGIYLAIAAHLAAFRVPAPSVDH